MLISSRAPNSGPLRRLRQRPTRTVVTGRLFLPPAQIAHPDVAELDHNHGRSGRPGRALLERCHREELLLIAPLFEEPGGGTIVPDGDRWRLEPAA